MDRLGEDVIDNGRERSEGNKKWEGFRWGGEEAVSYNGLYGEALLKGVPFSEDWRYILKGYEFHKLS